MIPDRSLADAVKASGIKHVTLIDDAFDLPHLDGEDFTSLFEIMSQPDGRQLLTELGFLDEDIDTALNQISNEQYRHDELNVVAGGLYRRYLITRDDRYDPAKIFASKVSNNLADVEPLLQLLGRCKVELTLVGREGPAPLFETFQPDLIFADYYLDETITTESQPSNAEQSKAKKASLERLEEVLKPSIAKNKHPSVVLMSSKDVSKQAEAYRKKASGEKGKVFASRFGFVLKSDIKIEGLPEGAPKGKPEPIFVNRPAADVLLDIIQSHPFGQELHEALLFWIQSSQSAVGVLKAEIEELQLKDFAYLVMYRLAQEGLSLFDYLEWFFGESLLGSIGEFAADKVGRPTRDKLDRHASLIEGAYDGRTDKVAQLYHRARIDTSRVSNEEMRMGDLYIERDLTNKPALVWAVLTPDCDLVVRDGKRSAERLLTVAGVLTPYDAPSSSLADFIIVENDRYSIDWKLKNLVTRETFDGLERLGTLRPLYAQDLQRQTLSDLGRVGLAVAPVIRMEGRMSLAIRGVDGKLTKMGLGAPDMHACEVYPNRGGTDRTRINVTRIVAENLVEQVLKLNSEGLDEEGQDNLKKLKERGKQMSLRASLLKGAIFDSDLSCKIIATDRMTVAKGWCGIVVEMVADTAQDAEAAVKVTGPEEGDGTSASGLIEEG